MPWGRRSLANFNEPRSVSIISVDNFDEWQVAARRLVVAGEAPEAVSFCDRQNQPVLFETVVGREDVSSSTLIRVPRSFLKLAQRVSYHRDPQRWNLLYRVLWRIAREEPHLLEISIDDDVRPLRKMEKQIRRDAHKTKAFVRFRKIGEEADGQEQFAAWHRPDHRVLPLVAPFFARRFRGMNWAIFTPDESVRWDQNSLVYGEGVPRESVPNSDEQDDMWRTYYRSIFNPARIKVETMKREMPVRHWSTLPETEIIDEMLEEAPERVRQMIAYQEGYTSTAADLISQHGDAVESLADLANLAANCRACDLHYDATQTVFGMGPQSAQIILVGEQPGDEEDIAGLPFVGPAGKLLEQALATAGVDRQQLYVTNVVKHFSHKVVETVRGKRRLHQKPKVREVGCCLPWFNAEMSLLTEARVVVCLGVTAATAVLRPDFKLSHHRGQLLSSRYCNQIIATWHPAAILRAPHVESKEKKLQQLVSDLRRAASACNS